MKPFHGRSWIHLVHDEHRPQQDRDFIKFRWPRFPNPKVTFPIDDAEKKRLEAAEDAAIDAIRAHAEQHPDTMAGIIIEPIQGEGGDNHFRPEFMRRLQNAAHDANALFMVDEVQTGCGATGRFWAYEHAEVQPDVLAFGKKMQVCGIMARDTVKEFEDNPFSTSAWINSTWGGNLIDMVRSGLQLEVVRDERLVENASRRGDELLRGLHARSKPHLALSPMFVGKACWRPSPCQIRPLETTFARPSTMRAPTCSTLDRRAFACDLL